MLLVDISQTRYATKFLFKYILARGITDDVSSTLPSYFNEKGSKNNIGDWGCFISKLKVALVVFPDDVALYISNVELLVDDK